MRQLAALCGILVLAMPVGAMAQTPSKTATLLTYSETFDGGTVLTAKNGKAIAEISVSLTGAVQLDGDIPADIAKSTGQDSKSPLVSGKTLLAWGADHIYCGAAKFVVDRVAPCLVDADNDGRFERAFKAIDIAMGYAHGFIMYKGLPMAAAGPVSGTDFTLLAPVPYHHVDGAELPRSGGKILWLTNHKPGAAGPAKIRFVYQASRALREDLAGDGPLVTFDGAPVDVELNGMVVSVVGFSPEGDLMYRLRGAMKAAPVTFDVSPAILKMTIYY